MTCEWCGHEHARDALCSGRPRWSRRGFLAMFGAGVAGLALAPSLPLGPQPEPWQALYAPIVTSNQGSFSMDQILKQYYEPIIAEQLKRRSVFTRAIGDEALPRAGGLWNVRTR